MPDSESDAQLPDIDSGVYLLDMEFDGETSFEDADFGANITVTRSKFNSEVFFSGAKFTDAAYFRKVQFTQRAFFINAGFWAELTIMECQFDNVVVFSEVHFHKDASFSMNTFAGIANVFDHSQFDGKVSFLRSKFVGELGLFDVDFRSSCSFTRATFTSGIHVTGVVFPADVDWDRARIETLQELAIIASGSVSLDYVSFPEGVHMIVCAPKMSLRNAHFERTSSIGACGCEIVLDSADFAQPTTLYYRTHTKSLQALSENSGDDVSAAEPMQDEQLAPVNDVSAADSMQDKQLAPVKDDEDLDLSTNLRLQEHARPVPRLLSVRYANVGQLSVVDIDLSACLFEGAQSLDTMTIEGRGLFATVSGLRYRPFTTAVPIQWWTRRQILAEELIWRVNHWPAILMPPGPVIFSREGNTVIEASRIAAIYRALRKSRELMKDEPGAADFYYGEMEMRRHSERSTWSERLILFLYWVTAGFGLRGSRSLVCLLGLTLLATIVLTADGFIGGSPGILRVALAAVAMIGRIGLSNTPPMTSLGETVRLTLEFIGPVLLGLMLLSIRNRLKR